jgi:hypothetical protein
VVKAFRMAEPSARIGRRLKERPERESVTDAQFRWPT